MNTPLVSSTFSCHHNCTKVSSVLATYQVNDDFELWWSLIMTSWR